MNRRTFLQNTSIAASVVVANASFPATRVFANQQKEVKPKIENKVAWYNVEHWGVEGRGWSETAKYFDRLPAKAEKTVRKAVWGLSRHSAGMMVRFASNAKSIRVRYELSSPNIAMSHMPATGVSGVDLYAENQHGEMRWVNVSRPGGQKVNAVLASNIDMLPNNAERNFALYMPLYNGVNSLEIGVEEGAKFSPLEPRKEKPVLFYGTSIMHGACASRPGMSISSIVGRQLQKPVINLGFSGNGKMEEAVGDLICELDPCLIAVDCLPNMNATLVKQRTEPLVRQIRKVHKETPILLVEDRSFTNSPFFKSRREHHAASRKELRFAFENLTKSGVSNLHYLEGAKLLGNDGEGATDGSHPNDLGMMRNAEAYIQKIQQIL